MIDLNNRTILTTRGQRRCHNLLTFDLLDDDTLEPTGLMRIGWIDKVYIKGNTTNDSLYAWFASKRPYTRLMFGENYTALVKRMLKNAPENVLNDYNRIITNEKIVELLEPWNENEPPLITKEQLMECLADMCIPILKKEDIYKHEYIRFISVK